MEGIDNLFWIEIDAMPFIKDFTRQPISHALCQVSDYYCLLYSFLFVHMSISMIGGVFLYDMVVVVDNVLPGADFNLKYTTACCV